MFTARPGNPVEPRSLAWSFARFSSGAGLRPVRLRNPRHTTATLLKQLGVPLRETMAVLGHSRIAVTFEAYTATDDTSRRDAITKVNGLFGSGTA